MIWQSTTTTYPNLDYSNTFVIDMTSLATKINIDKMFLKKQTRNKLQTMLLQ